MITAAIASSTPPWVIVTNSNLTMNRGVFCGRDGMPGFENTVNGQKSICAYGFAIDVFRLLQRKLNFNYNIIVSRDGFYGTYDNQTGASTGVVREILESTADMGLDLLENKVRAQNLWFSKPYLISSLAYIYVKPDSFHDTGIFKPFETNLWLGILASIICVIIFIWILEKFSPYGVHERSQRSIDNEGSFNSFDSANYIWGTYFTGEIIVEKPTSFGSRATTTIISIVAIIFIAAYSGNLITYLIVLNETPPINGLFDERVSTDFI